MVAPRGLTHGNWRDSAPSGRPRSRITHFGTHTTSQSVLWYTRAKSHSSALARSPSCAGLLTATDSLYHARAGKRPDFREAARAASRRRVCQARCDRDRMTWSPTIGAAAAGYSQPCDRLCACELRAVNGGNYHQPPNGRGTERRFTSQGSQTDAEP